MSVLHYVVFVCMMYVVCCLLCVVCLFVCLLACLFVSIFFLNKHIHIRAPIGLHFFSVSEDVAKP